MGAFYDITGNKYGRLTVIKRIPNTLERTTRWLCKCDCGKLHEVNKNMLINGTTQSCGCYARELFMGNKLKETHDESRTRLYRVWQSMKQRCYDKNTNGYKDYGARGITVCEEWLKYENFSKWAKENGYQDNLTIDRKDNSKGYSPDNCRWLTIKEQNRNKRYNHIIELNGEKHCMGYWSEKLKIPMSTIVNRTNRGCTPEEILNTDYHRRS